VPEVFSLKCPGPFDTECVVQSWLAKVVSQCDGQSTWGELMDSAKTAGMIDHAITPAEVGAILTAMAASGLLRIAEMPLD